MKRICSLVLAAVLMCSLCFSSAAGGSRQDPVVTKSYIDGTYIPFLQKTAQEEIDRRFDEILKGTAEKAADLTSPSGVLALLIKAAGYSLSYGAGEGSYDVDGGMYVGGGLGTFFTPADGSFTAYIASGGAIVDVTDGKECKNGQALKTGHLYIAASEGGAALRAEEDSALIISGCYFSLGFGTPKANEVSSGGGSDIPAGSGVKYKKYADALYELGLFSGTDIGYELDRSATRAESIVMLLRLLGELSNAQDYQIKYKFKDVPDWASHYISYAYNKGYTAGMSEKQFGSTNTVSAVQYLTFVLRALGYKDEGVDFVWDSSDEFAVKVGLISESERAAFKTRFWRDEMVLVSYRALSAKLKNSDIRLVDKLVSVGAVEQMAAGRIS